jgi:ABC-type polysaccharide/polyol phosphate transport system ATPase subunit
MVLASHSLDLVRKLCTKAILMEHGRIKWSGDIEKALTLYLGGAV